MGYVAVLIVMVGTMSFNFLLFYYPDPLDAAYLKAVHPLVQPGD